MDIFLGASGIVIIIAMVLLACVLWKVAKLILIPVQILLFLALMFIAYKLLFSPENMDKLSDKVKDGSIQELVDKAAGSAARMVKKAAAGNSGPAQAPADSQAGAAQAAGTQSADSAAKAVGPEKEAAVSEKSAAPAESVK